MTKHFQPTIVCSLLKFQIKRQITFEYFSNLFIKIVRLFSLCVHVYDIDIKGHCFPDLIVFIFVFARDSFDRLETFRTVT